MIKLSTVLLFVMFSLSVVGCSLYSCETCMEGCMRKDLTDITVILDRSGSMSECKADAEGGLNQFVKDQQKVKGDCTYTLVQFDTEYEFVHKGVDIKEVGEFTLVPRGWTALLDAIGRAINETGKRLKDTKHGERPGLVTFVIITDGAENSSKEFNRNQIKEMIELQKDKYNWKFIYLGANQDAFTEAQSLGISMDSIANYNISNTDVAFTAASGNISSMRDSVLTGGVADSSFSDEQREEMVD